MFKSAEYKAYIGHDEATHQSRYEYKITDTDFEDVGFGFGQEAGIIDCYTKKNLPVVPNLIRYMLLHREKYGNSLDFQVEWNKQHNPRWHEVEKDLQMYLTFS